MKASTSSYRNNNHNRGKEGRRGSPPIDNAHAHGHGLGHSHFGKSKDRAENEDRSISRNRSNEHGDSSSNQISINFKNSLFSKINQPLNTKKDVSDASQS